jgi:hypothetical protein
VSFRPRFFCVECHRAWADPRERWRAYRVDVPGEDDEPQLAFYCPPCAYVAFGENDVPTEHEPFRDESDR